MKLQIIIISIHCFIATKASEENFKNTEINSTGIFFEQIGNAAFYSKEVDIITSIKLPEWEELINDIIYCTKQLEMLCTEVLKTDTDNQCNNLIYEIKWQIDEIKKQDNKLNEMYGHQRIKRGLVDGIGRLSNFLFGTMDSENANEIYNNLDQLNQNQAKFMELESQQIAVIQSNYNTLTKPITELQNETENINNRLNNLIQLVNEQTYSKELKTQIAEISSLLIIKCLHVDRQQDEASEIMEALENHKLHPLVIPYNNISSIIKKIGTTINMDEETINHEQLRQILDLNYVELTDQIIIKITIPIIEKQKYTLYKTYLTPMIINGTRTAYNIDTEYIAANTERTKFIMSHNQEIQACKTITANLEAKFKLCKHTQPIITDATKHCLPALLDNPFESTRNCDYISSKPVNTIIKLTHDNTWLYSLETVTKIKIECGKNTKTLEIVNNGIITFFKPCKITTRDLIIETEGNKDVVTFEQPKTLPTLEEITAHQTRQKNLKTHTDAIQSIKIISHIDHNKNFRTENERIENLKNTLNSINNHEIYKNNETKFIPHIMTTATTVTILLVIITIYKCKNKKLRQTNRPTPTNEIKVIKIEEDTTQQKPPDTPQNINIQDDDPNKYGLALAC